MNELTARARSKWELWSLLVFSCKVALPPRDKIRMSYLFKIVTKKKNWVHRDQYKVVETPHFE